MHEVYTMGGGIYLREIFNAVAAISGWSGFANLIIGVAAFSMLWLMFQTGMGTTTWANNARWFASFLVLYSALLVPKVDVRVVDRLNPALANPVVSNVPFGLAFFASASSTLGDGLTKRTESTLTLPNDLKYQKFGMLFGSKLLEESTKVRITDPVMAGNMNRMIQQCVFYGILHGNIDPQQLATSKDLWAFIRANAGSNLRAFDYSSRSGSSITRSIVTCTNGINMLDAELTKALPAAYGTMAGRLIPGVNWTTASSLVAPYLQSSTGFLLKTSNTASEHLRQQIMINAYDDSFKDWAGSLGNEAALDSYVKARAEAQALSTYRAVGLQAEKFVPLLFIIFQALYYGCFPVALLLMLSPVGWRVFSAYLGGFLWIQSWGPLFALMHFIMMGWAQEEATNFFTAYNVSGGVPMVAQLGMRSLMQETSAHAGIMAMSIPFIAGVLLFRGASGFTHMATSMLAPAQQAAAAGAMEATTGNLNLGNVSLDNASLSNVSANQMRSSGSVDTGRFSAVNQDGQMMTLNPNGNVTMDKGTSVSNLPWSGSVGTAMGEGLSTRIAQSQQQSQQAANQYASSMEASRDNTLTFGESVSNSTSFTSGENLGLQSRVSENVENINAASKNFSEQTGYSLRDSTEIVLSAGASISGGGGFLGQRAGYEISGKGSGSAQELSNEDWATAQSIAETFNVTESMASIREAGQSFNFSDQQSDLAEMREGMNASLREAHSAQENYSESISTQKAYEEAQDRYERDSTSFNMDLTQKALNFGANRDFGGNVVSASEAALQNPNLASDWVDHAVSGHLNSIPLENNVAKSVGDLKSEQLGEINQADRDYITAQGSGMSAPLDRLTGAEDIRNQVEEAQQKAEANLKEKEKKASEIEEKAEEQSTTSDVVGSVRDLAATGARRAEKLID